MMEHSHSSHEAAPVSGDARLDLSERQAATRRITIVGAITNTLLAIAQLLGGFFTQSQALLADGIHTLSDLVSDFVVLIASHHAHKEADANHPYGHGRIETLGTVVLGLMLAVVAVAIFMRGWERLVVWDTLTPPRSMATFFAALAIVSKETLYHYTMRVAKRIHSNMLRANAWHHRSDAISSVVVLLGIAGALMGYPWLDPLAAMVVAGMILYMAGQLLLESTRELVDTGLEPEEVQQIEDFACAIEGVDNIHMLRTRRMGGHVLADIHLQVDGRISVSEGHFIGETVMYRLKRKFRNITDVIVHIDPENDETAHPCKSLPSRAQLLRELQVLPAANALWPAVEEITLHYIDGKISLDIILDVGVPQETLADFKRACNTVACIEQVRFLQDVESK